MAKAMRRAWYAVWPVLAGLAVLAAYVTLILGFTRWLPYVFAAIFSISFVLTIGVIVHHRWVYYNEVPKAEGESR